MRPIIILLRRLQILLNILYPVYIEEIVLLQLRKFLVQSICALKVQLIHIVVIIKLNQIQTQQLLKPLLIPLFTVVTVPVDDLLSVCFLWLGRLVGCFALACIQI